VLPDIQLLRRWLNTSYSLCTALQGEENYTWNCKSSNWHFNGTWV